MFLSAALCRFCYKSHDILIVLFIGFSFGEVGCIRTRNKVTCCHFSSDGKLLASAGHDKKVVQLCLQMLCFNKTGMFHVIFNSFAFFGHCNLVSGFPILNLHMWFNYIVSVLFYSLLLVL